MSVIENTILKGLGVTLTSTAAMGTGLSFGSLPLSDYPQAVKAIYLAAEELGGCDFWLMDSEDSSTGYFPAQAAFSKLAIPVERDMRKSSKLDLAWRDIFSNSEISSACSQGQVVAIEWDDAGLAWKKAASNPTSYIVGSLLENLEYKPASILESDSIYTKLVANESALLPGTEEEWLEIANGYWLASRIGTLGSEKILEKSQIDAASPSAVASLLRFKCNDILARKYSSDTDTSYIAARRWCRKPVTFKKIHESAAKKSSAKILSDAEVGKKISENLEWFNANVSGWWNTYWWKQWWRMDSLRKTCGKLEELTTAHWNFEVLWKLSNEYCQYLMR